MADSYYHLGRLAQARGNYDEAAPQYQRALGTFERLGNQKGMAHNHHQLGSLAQARGDYDEAARQYQRALDIYEWLGDQPNIANSYGQLGVLAQARGDYDEAARQYQRALGTYERLGNQNGMAATYSQLGSLENERGGSITATVTWHVKALVIRLRLGVPQAVIDLRRLATYRRELGTEPFTSLLAQTADDTDLVDAITSLLDELDKTGDNTA